jgi:non-ribosomal peptide synthetase component F
VLDDCGAAVLFRHPDQVDPPTPCATAVPLDEGYEALLAGHGGGPVEPPPVDERATAEIFYTSGSTGDPQGRDAHAPGASTSTPCTPPSPTP